MSLTQYLKSQKDQDMIRLLNFTRIQERGREGGFFLSFGIKEREDLYSNSGENMNRMQFMRVDKES